MEDRKTLWVTCNAFWSHQYSRHLPSLDKWCAQIFWNRFICIPLWHFDLSQNHCRNAGSTFGKSYRDFWRISLCWSWEAWVPLKEINFGIHCGGSSGQLRHREGLSSEGVASIRKQLQQFLGFENLYRRFIRDFSRVVAPLTALPQSNLSGARKWMLLLPGWKDCSSQPLC